MVDIQKQAEENERRIVRFTNIDSEDFTHSFRGISITVKKGESYIARLPEGDHLATHLARKILSREKKAKGADKDPKGTILWSDKEIDELKDKIIQEVGSETPKTITPEEERKRDQENLQQKYSPTPKAPDVTKADIIKDLEARGEKVDVKKSKEELLQQLMDAEAQGK